MVWEPKQDPELYTWVPQDSPTLEDLRQALCIPGRPREARMGRC